MPALQGTLEQSALFPAFWTLVAVGTFGAAGLGARIIRRRLPKSIAIVPHNLRAERTALRVLEEGQVG